MESKQITSKFMSLLPRDFIRGLVMAALAPVFTIIGQSISAGNITFDWTAIWHTAAAAGLAYLAKNFFEPTKTVIIVQPPLTNVEGEKTVNVKTDKTVNN